MAKLIRAIVGPQTGLFELPDDEADAAIKAGWAVDPYSSYDLSDWDQAKAEKAAIAAYDKRNAPADAPKEVKKAEPKAEAPKEEAPKEEAKPAATPKASASKE